jgi:hypothetical protein
MARRKPARQYTIRNVPDAVDRALRRTARGQGQSLNRVARDALSRGAGVEGDATVFEDLDTLIGKWEDDPVFDAALADQDAVDETLWR